MKKYIIGILLLLATFFLASCESNQDYKKNKSPLINAEESYQVEVGTTNFDLGTLITAEDDVDGMISITRANIDYRNFDVSVLGTYQVLVTVIDSNEAITNKSVTLHVVDTVMPTISLLGDAEVSIVAGETYSEQGVNVVDNYDTAVQLKVVGAVDNTTTGTYELEYYATDSSGNKSDSVFRTITVTTSIPIVSVESVVPTQTTVSFVIAVDDSNQLGEITSIKLYNDQTLVDSVSNLTTREFTGLQPGIRYTLQVVYTYTMPSAPASEVVITETATFVVVSQNDIDESGFYTSKDDVANYLATYGRLPGNFMTKSEAGGRISSLHTKETLASIGGDNFQNREGHLPSASGRLYYEVDINYKGYSRGAERIVFSNDGFIFYTSDHYDSFVLYDPITKEWVNYSKDDAIFN